MIREPGRQMSGYAFSKWRHGCSHEHTRQLPDVTVDGKKITGRRECMNPWCRCVFGQRRACTMPGCRVTKSKRKSRKTR